MTSGTLLGGCDNTAARADAFKREPAILLDNGARPGDLEAGDGEQPDSGDEEHQHGQYLTFTIRLRRKAPIDIATRQKPISTWPVDVL